MSVQEESFVDYLSRSFMHIREGIELNGGSFLFFRLDHLRSILEVV